MFCASIFNLRGLISLEMISMPLALTEKWREREALWVSCGVILEADVWRGRNGITAPRRSISTFETGGMRNHE